MPRGVLSADEKAAGGIVARQVGGTVVPRDVPGAPDGTHDLDIKMPDGSVIAVEVTSARESKLLSIYATAFGKRWEAPSLSAHWQVAFESGKALDVPRLAEGVVPHLELLEKRGVMEAGTITSAAWRRAGDDVVRADHRTRSYACEALERACHRRNPAAPLFGSSWRWRQSRTGQRSC